MAIFRLYHQRQDFKLLGLTDLHLHKIQSKPNIYHFISSEQERKTKFWSHNKVYGAYFQYQKSSDGAISLSQLM